MSQVRLMRWYTPEQVHDRVEAYNDVVQERVSAAGPVRPLGELALRLGAPGRRGVLPGLRLTATF